MIESIAEGVLHTLPFFHLLFIILSLIPILIIDRVALGLGFFSAGFNVIETAGAVVVYIVPIICYAGAVKTGLAGIV